MKKNTQTQPSPLPKENTPPAINVPPSTSWAEKVKISDSSTRFKLDPIPRRSPGGKLCITEEMLLNTSEQWNRCMVGFIPGFKMSHRMVNTIASRVWRSCGLENVTTMSNGFMLFRFKTEAEMQDVMERGPWLFGGKAIVLQQWHPGFKFDKNKISKLPVWIRLHGLPFPLWSQEGLSLAASMVGRPLSCDAQTYNCQRLEFARLCVEIDAALPKVTSFEVVSHLSFDPITVEVEYEWLPSHCASCKTYGHSCKRSNKPTPTNDEPHLTMVQPSSTLMPNTDPAPPTTTAQPNPPSDHNPGKNPVSNGNTTTASHPQPTESQTRVQPNVIAPQKQAPSQHDSTTVGKIVRSKEIPSLIRTDSKFTALVKFGHSMEECHSSKLDSLGSRTLLNTASDETGDESSAKALLQESLSKLSWFAVSDGRPAQSAWVLIPELWSSFLAWFER
uniref:DUF4283 domain-containing protein n=1 Tax=Salix viminalis TaxID=40686 RepID=A0A6N2MAS7_SALVM